MRPYISEVTSNLKSPDKSSWHIKLGQRTLIVGSNASHKSSILQACELALTGAVDDLVWRSVVRDVALLVTMAPDDTLVSNILLSNGGYHDFKVVAGYRAPSTSFAQNTLPIRQVREAIAGGPATARKMFLPWLAGELTDADLLAHIPAKLHNKFKDLLQHVGQGQTRADALLRIEEYAGKQQRDAAKECKGAQSIIGELTSQMEEAPSVEALAAAEVRLHDLLSVKPAPKESEEVVRARIVKARQKFNEFEEIASHLMFESSAENILTSAQTHALDQCPVCSSQIGTEHLDACLTHYRNLNQSLEEKHALTYVEAVQGMGFAEQEVTADEDMLTYLLLPSSESTTEDIVKAQAEYDDLKTAQVKWQTLTAAKRKVEQYEEDVATYKNLKAACSKAIAALVKERSAGFCSVVASFLPKGWEFSLKVDAKTFRIGLLRDGEIHSALCGAEGAAVITAIAMATSSTLPAHMPAVLIPEDRAFDPRTLAAVMRGYNKFDGQVIMASTVRPRGRPSKHWTIIDLDTDPLTTIAAAAAVDVVARIMPAANPAVEDAPEPAPAPTPAPAAAAPAPAAPVASAPVMPPPPKQKVIRRKKDQIPERNLRILKGLGFDEETIAKLTVETAAEIVKAGHIAANICIGRNGEIQVRSSWTKPATYPSSPQ